VGSSSGITRFTGGKADFGATDVPASAHDLAGASGGATVQVPVDLGAVVVAYNAPVLNGEPLKLTGPVIARIFLGQIKRWDDPAITALNPGADLPQTYINVVHRSDGSGTTYIFSNYLSSVSPAWASRIGTSRSLRWPTGFGAPGNHGVAGAIARTQYSIGYVESSYTAGISVGAAAIQNRAGRYTTPTAAAITADAAARPHITPDSFSIVNEPGPAAYPISGYSWILVSKHQTSQAAGQALVNLVTWLTHGGQSYAATLGYVPLPPAIQQLAATMLRQVTGPGGTPFSS
jgi:phosphate transport system substrate-binding protein